MNDEGNLYAEYENFKYWVSKLKDIDVPVPNIVNMGKYKNYNYINRKFNYYNSSK